LLDYFCLSVCSSLLYFETSAATGQNVSKTIEALLDLVMIRIQKSVDNSSLLSNPNDNSNFYPTIKLSEQMTQNEKLSSCGC